jgi:hypothetical protein
MQAATSPIVHFISQLTDLGLLDSANFQEIGLLGQSSTFEAKPNQFLYRAAERFTNLTKLEAFQLLTSAYKHWRDGPKNGQLLSKIAVGATQGYS